MAHDLAGVGVLGVEFVWARRLFRRLKKGAAELICSVFVAHKIVDAQPSPPRKDNLHGTDSDRSRVAAAFSVHNAGDILSSSPQPTLWDIAV